MEYTNYNNPSYGESVPIQPQTSPTTPSVPTVEANRTESESVDQRLYETYKNDDSMIGYLTPVSTEDAPLITPIPEAYNEDIASELNAQTQPPRPMPMPSFTTASRTRDTSRPDIYTPLGDKTAPESRSLYQSPANYSTPNGYSNLSTNYTMDPNYNMYLPIRNTPYYNLASPENESIGDFDAAEQDMEYLRQLYPYAWRLLEDEIEEECDKLEYEGSFMFDEYPDRVTLDRCIERIYNRVKDRDDFKQYASPLDDASVRATQINYYPCPTCNWLQDLTRIMFLNQIGNRRRRYRSRRRWFF